MSLDFVQNFEQVGRRIQWRQWMAAACWALAGVAATAFLLMAADRWIGVYHFAARALLTALLVVAATLTVRRAARRLSDRKTPLQVALLLEQDDAELRSLLASGVEFSAQDPAHVTAGSAELRRGVVLRAALASERVDLAAAVARRAPLGKATAAAMVALAAIAATTAWAPQGVAIGVARLLNPFTQVEWPRRHDLAFVDPPPVVAVGGDFRVKLHDRRGALPAKVVVEYRTQRQGRWHHDSQRYASDGSSLEIVWPNVRGPFEFRARGGDHRTMPWNRVATAKAPQVESLHATVRAPNYAGQPDQWLAEPLRILRGSTVDVTARTTEAVASARLEAEGQPPVRLKVGDGGRKLEVSPGTWRPAATAQWSIRMTTPGGLTTTATRPLRIDVTPDWPPMAEIIEPAGELSVLQAAQIELTVEARDDVGLRKLVLESRAADSPSRAPRPVEVRLFEAADRGGDRTIAQQTVHHSFDVGTLGATPGSVWEIRAEASDFAGHENHALRPLRVRVITPEQFWQRIEATRAQLRAALDRAREHQLSALSRVESSSRGEAGVVPTGEQALAAMARQRQAARSVAQRQDAAVPILATLLDEFRRNGLEAHDELPRLQRLDAELEGLTRETLPTIEDLLAQLVRGLEQADEHGTGQPSPARLLPDIQARQRQSLAVLEAALRELEAASLAESPSRELAESNAEMGRISPSSTTGKPSESGMAGTKSGASTSRGDAKPEPLDRAAVARLVNDRWGRLPQRQRDELLQPLSQEFIPEYAAETEAYFRSLAEPHASQESQP